MLGFLYPLGQRIEFALASLRFRLVSGDRFLPWNLAPRFPLPVHAKSRTFLNRFHYAWLVRLAKVNPPIPDFILANGEDKLVVATAAMQSVAGVGVNFLVKFSIQLPCL